jgi:hypothetical protein
MYRVVWANATTICCCTLADSVRQPATNRVSRIEANAPCLDSGRAGKGDARAIPIEASAELPPG